MNVLILLQCIILLSYYSECVIKNKTKQNKTKQIKSCFCLCVVLELTKLQRSYSLLPYFHIHTHSDTFLHIAHPLYRFSPNIFEGRCTTQIRGHKYAIVCRYPTVVLQCPPLSERYVHSKPFHCYGTVMSPESFSHFYKVLPIKHLTTNRLQNTILDI